MTLNHGETNQIRVCYILRSVFCQIRGLPVVNYNPKDRPIKSLQ